MARPLRPWFRFYVEAISDPKLRRLPPAERWLWTAVLGAARRSPIPGALMVTERDPMTCSDLADWAAMSERDVRRAIPKFVAADMLDVSDVLGGAWVVRNWQARQFESDDVTERTRKHRAKTTDRNVPTSFPERSRNGKGTILGTPPESETENRITHVGFRAHANGSPSPPDSDKSTPAGEAAAKLIDRWLAVIERPTSMARADAERWIPHLRSVLSDDVIDECIGRCAQDSRSRPQGIRYLVRTCRDWAGINLPGVEITEPCR